MGEEYGGPQPVEHGGDPIGNDVHVERPRVWRHRAEKLVERLGAPVELHAFEVVRPQPHAELVEPELLVGSGL
ncbi:hypothetical protein D3C72_2199400 [compost metagenome]